jgi:hypothetical protein
MSLNGLRTYIELPKQLPNRAPFTFELAMKRGHEKAMACQVGFVRRDMAAFDDLFHTLAWESHLFETDRAIDTP